MIEEGRKEGKKKDHQLVSYVDKSGRTKGLIRASLTWLVHLVWKQMDEGNNLNLNDHQRNERFERVATNVGHIIARFPDLRVAF